MRRQTKIPAPVFRTLLADSSIRPTGRTAQALRLVMVDGVSIPDAATAHGISRQAVQVAVRRIERIADTTLDVCPCCGQRKPDR
jgi:predicted DNA-binding protein (UPF0251 family)